MSKKLITIDVGGTTIKSDLYDENGNRFPCGMEVRTEIDREKGTNGILSQICDLVRRYQREHEISGIGVCTAGVVSAESGEVIYSGYTIPGYSKTPIREVLKERFRLPVVVENDVNCAAFGEAGMGAGKGRSSVVMITIGTGIGGGVVLDGEIYRGRGFTAGEVGYLPYLEGDWQSYASASALLAQYRAKTGKELRDGKEFFKLTDEKDGDAEAVLADYLEHLVHGLLPLCYILNPDCLILGGGIMARADILLEKTRRKLSEKIVSPRFLPGEVVAAALGNQAGRIGALCLLLRHMEKDMNRMN